MREQFFKTVSEFAEKDKDVLLLINDVGYSYFEEFKARFPKQFINCGIIEQTIMGMAAGLALAGKKPYVYSMIPFVTMRNFEQLRNDVCYQNANVKILGVKGSEHYKFLGESHNIIADEDIQILKVLPNLTLYVPRTKEEVDAFVRLEYARCGPSYMRI